MSIPSSGSTYKPSKNQAFCLPPAFTLVSYSACSTTLNMVVASSSKTSVYFSWTTLCYISEDRNLERSSICRSCSLGSSVAPRNERREERFYCESLLHAEYWIPGLLELPLFKSCLPRYNSDGPS
jgi:hypothetical protein